VPGVAGTWKDLTDNVNSMANNLTGQVRNIADVATAIARGDLSRKITVDVKGEILQLKILWLGAALPSSRCSRYASSEKPFADQQILMRVFVTGIASKLDLLVSRPA
jgi:hypothetical protein